MKRLASNRALAVVLMLGSTAGVTALLPTAAFAAPSTSIAHSLTSTSQGTTPTRQRSSPNAGQPSDPQCTPSLFTQAQQLVEAELSGRVTQLNDLANEVANTSNHLTSSDRQTLQDQINDFELPGIEALQPQVGQAVTCAQLRTDAHSMVFTYRVYIVMTPQTHLTIAGDDETYIEGLLMNVESTISSAVNRSTTNGSNLSAAQAAFKDLLSQVSQAQTATNGLSAQVLAQTPAGAPGNWQFFLQARTSLTNARTDLHAAYADALQIKADLT
jgi:hypothetical protein